MSRIRNRAELELETALSENKGLTYNGGYIININAQHDMQRKSPNNPFFGGHVGL